MKSPYTLTDDLVRPILTARREGKRHELCAAAGGVSTKTLSNWNRLGRNGDHRYASFATEYSRAYSEHLRDITRELAKFLEPMEDD